MPAGLNGALLEFETVGPSGRHIVSAKNKRTPTSVRLTKRRRFPTLIQDGVPRTLTFLYTDEKLTVIIAGTLIDGQTMKNYSAERLQKLTAIRFSDLPLDLAVKQVRGDGKRILATFEDPNCGYCKKLAKDMVKLDNVTLYTFLYPILSPDSLEKSNQIWCSSDKAKAWNEWMQDGKTLTGKGDCDTMAVKKSIDLGRKLAITGTPTLFFADGERVQGVIPLAQIEKKLDQITQ